MLLGSRIIPLSELKHPRRVAQNLLTAMAEVGESPTVDGLMVIGPGVREADPSGEHLDAGMRKGE